MATEQEIAEEKAKARVAELLSSQAWRLANLYWIENENGVKVKFRPRWEQRQLHDNWHSQNIVLKCRQPGISTYCALRELDFALFSKNKTCGIIDKTDDDAKKKLDKVRFAYDHLDDPDDPATAQIGAMVKATVRLRVDNTKEMEWSNDSKIWAGTSMRGGTLQFLWISELGHVSFYSPEVAEEIRKGALNTIHSGNTIVIEATHEGGKFGVFYALLCLAMESKEPLTAMDWRFHFFPWWRHFGYVLSSPGLHLDAEHAAYFKSLEEQGIKLTSEQKFWYVKKHAAIENAILSEFPSTVSEAFEAVIKGAIYGSRISQLRAAKRIVDFEHDRTFPLYSFWDIGYSDFTAIWLLQFSGRDICALAYRCNCREDPPYYAAVIKEWERKYQMPVAINFLPHDANAKEKSGKSYVEYLMAAGLENIRVVTRTPDEWLGIRRLRALLPRFIFHKTECGRTWQHDGRTMPSGIGCLEGYHTKEDASSGVIRENPVHDENSHGAAAIRTFAEADMNGMIPGGDGYTYMQAPGSGQVILAGWNRPRGEGRTEPRVIRW